MTPLITFLALVAVPATTVATTVFTFDLHPTLSMPKEDAYEIVHAVSAIAGIVNRNTPRLWVNYTAADPAWLDYAKSRSSHNGWLAADFQPLATLVDVVTTFSGSLKGAAVYDPRVPATSNLASTAAGALDVVPVCYRNVSGSVYSALVQPGGPLPVALSLVDMFSNTTSTKSAKNDAYRWGIQFFISGASGPKVDPTYLAYYLDYYWTRPYANAPPSGDYTTNKVSNHDFWISKRAFFFDLSFWDDEAPNDDPTQPVGTDFETVKMMLAAVYAANKGAMTWMGGFTPWYYKYITAQHQGVPTEWQTAKVLSQYSVFLDADACCVGGAANLAFFSTFPLADRYVQHPPPQLSDFQASGYVDSSGNVTPAVYVAWYVGDYDSAAWLNRNFLDNWDDPARGSVKLGWALNPQLSARFPLVFDMVMNELAPGDVVTAGDSGAGYLNPTGLFNRPLSGLPAGGAVWQQHCTAWYQKFSISFSGFLINGASGSMTPEAQALYQPFSWDGMTDQTGYAPSPNIPYLSGNTPVFEEMDVNDGDPATAAQTILSAVQHDGPGVHFHVYRSILKSASWHKAVVDAVTAANANVKFLNAVELGYLARVSLGGNNDDRVVYVADTLQASVAVGSSTPFNVTVRNDGWNTLATGERHAAASRVTLQWVMGSASGGAQLAMDMPPTATVVFEATLTTPPAPGVYLLAYQLVVGGTDSFDHHGNPARFANVEVVQ